MEYGSFRNSGLGQGVWFKNINGNIFMYMLDIESMDFIFFYVFSIQVQIQQVRVLSDVSVRIFVYGMNNVGLIRLNSLKFI